MFFGVIGALAPSVDCSNADESGFNDEQEMRPQPSETNVGFEALIDVPGKFCKGPPWAARSRRPKGWKQPKSGMLARFGAWMLFANWAALLRRQAVCNLGPARLAIGGELLLVPTLNPGDLTFFCTKAR
jgi:hypothetical protein